MKMCKCPKWPICPKQFFLVQTIIITFIYPLALFILQNLKKILTADSELMIMCHFWAHFAHTPTPPPPPTPLEKNFFGGGIINIIRIYLLAHFIVQNF